jgi:BolA protein
MSVTGEIKSRLEAAFAPETLDVINESHQHAGHAGHDGSGESHFRVVIRAAAFDGMNRLKRHRAVHDAIGPDLIARIHALTLEIDSPAG